MAGGAETSKYAAPPAIGRLVPDLRVVFPLESS